MSCPTANKSSLANRSAGSYLDAIKRPAVNDENKRNPPVVRSSNASGSDTNQFKILTPPPMAGKNGANFNGGKRGNSLDLSTLLYVPDYAQKRQSEAIEATRNIVEKRGSEPYAPQRVALTNIVASARLANPPKPVEGLVASDQGNFGAALVAIQGVPTELISSSYSWAKPDGWTSKYPDSHESYQIVRNTENHQFKSQKVGAHVRNVDSEAKILNFIAARLKGKSNPGGTIILYTELPPCTSCNGVISAFKQAFPNIDLIVLNNEGYRPHS